jgi:thioredoxin reductase/bacterioferritin-associated ferredoxin
VREAELVVIGGGPAGISAAIEAARRDVAVVLVDENRSLGGKVLKLQESGLVIRHSDPFEAEVGRNLLGEFERIAGKVTLYLNTEVWNIDDQKIVELYSENKSASPEKRIRAQKLIIAAGAQERAVPFPGWTLPGVFTVGGLNTLVKRGVLPGKNFLVAGSGPLLLVLAQNLLNAGANLRAIVEAASTKDILGKSVELISTAGMPRLRQAAAYLYNIIARRVPFYHGHAVVRAMGENEVSKVVAAKLGADWKPIPGMQKEFPVDAVAVGYSLMPSVELSRICGCRHSFDERLGYWCVDRNDRLETTISGVFVAGDSSRIKGYQAAIDEGRAAGIAACSQLGKLSKDQADQLIRPLQCKLIRAKNFGQALDAVSAPRAGILDSMPDDTVICRCEEVTLRHIRNAVAQGAGDINDIKRRTRLGMGHCQGRFCGQMINELLWKISGEKRKREIFTPRIPVKPVPFGALLE